MWAFVVSWQPRVYLRGGWLAQQIHALVAPNGVRSSKRVDQLLEEYGVNVSVISFYT